jgi:hypothetical protein
MKMIWKHLALILLIFLAGCSEFTYAESEALLNLFADYLEEFVPALNDIACEEPFCGVIDCPETVCPVLPTATEFVLQIKTPTPSNIPDNTFTDEPGNTDPIVLISPTATRIPSLTPSQLPSTTPTLLPTQTKTPVPSVTWTSTPNPSKTPALSSIRFNVQPNNPFYIQNFAHPQAGCNWFGVGGQVFDKYSRPIEGLVVSLEGTLNSSSVDLLGLTGNQTAYGPGGYEIKLGDKPAISNGSLQLAIFDLAGLPLSAPVIINTTMDCSKNLVLVNFVQK